MYVYLLYAFKGSRCKFFFFFSFYFNLPSFFLFFSIPIIYLYFLFFFYAIYFVCSSFFSSFTIHPFKRSRCFPYPENAQFSPLPYAFSLTVCSSLVHSFLVWLWYFVQLISKVICFFRLLQSRPLSIVFHLLHILFLFFFHFINLYFLL